MLAADAVLVALLAFAPWLKLDLYYYYQDFTLPNLVKSAEQLGDMLGSSGSASNLVTLVLILGLVCLVSIIPLAADFYNRLKNEGESNVYVFVFVLSLIVIFSVVIANESISSSVGGSDYSFAAPTLASIIKLDYGAYATAIISGVAAWFQKQPVAK